LLELLNKVCDLAVCLKFYRCVGIAESGLIFAGIPCGLNLVVLKFA